MHKSLEKFTIHICQFCSEGVRVKHNVTAREYFCPSCIQNRQKASHQAAINSIDPRIFPQELRDYPLSFIEEQLIALVQINQYVYVRRTGAIATKGISIFILVLQFARLLETISRDRKISRKNFLFLVILNIKTQNKFFQNKQIRKTDENLIFKYFFKF